jgi:hypothetical protein
MRGYKVQFNQPSYPPDLLAIDNNTTFHEIDVDPLLQFDLSKKASHPFIKVGPSFNFILWVRKSITWQLVNPLIAP